MIYIYEFVTYLIKKDWDMSSFLKKNIFPFHSVYFNLNLGLTFLQTSKIKLCLDIKLKYENCMMPLTLVYFLI